MHVGQTVRGACVQTLDERTGVGDSTVGEAQGETVQGGVVRGGQQAGEVTARGAGGVHEAQGEGVQHGGPAPQATGPPPDGVGRRTAGERQVQALQPPERDAPPPLRARQRHGRQGDPVGLVGPVDESQMTPPQKAPPIVAAHGEDGEVPLVHEMEEDVVRQAGEGHGRSRFALQTPHARNKNLWRRDKQKKGGNMTRRGEFLRAWQDLVRQTRLRRCVMRGLVLDAWNHQRDASFAWWQAWLGMLYHILVVAPPREALPRLRSALIQLAVKRMVPARLRLGAGE